METRSKKVRQLVSGDADSRTLEGEAAAGQEAATRPGSLSESDPG